MMQMTTTTMANNTSGIDIATYFRTSLSMAVHLAERDRSSNSKDIDLSLCFLYRVIILVFRVVFLVTGSLAIAILDR